MGSQPNSFGNVESKDKNQEIEAIESALDGIAVEDLNPKKQKEYTPKICCIILNKTHCAYVLQQ